MSSRYFVAGMHRLDLEEHERNKSSPAESLPTSPSASPPRPSRPTSSGPMVLVNSLLEIARSGSSSSAQRPMEIQPDFLPLPADEETDQDLFYIDRDGTNSGSADQPLPRVDMECPGHIDGMLQIVRELRAARLEALSAAWREEPTIVTPATQERSAAKAANMRNINVTNLSDLM